MNNDILELVRDQEGVGTINTETGELVMLLDPEVPLEQKADSYAYVLSCTEAQIEVSERYIDKHKDKIEKLLLFRDRVRQDFHEQMKARGLSTLKTPEVTIYTQRRKKLVYNLIDIPENYCVTQLVKKSIDKEYLPELIEQGLVLETETETLCRR